MLRKQRIKIKNSILFEALDAFDVLIGLVCRFSCIRVQPSSVWLATRDRMELETKATLWLARSATR